MSNALVVSKLSGASMAPKRIHGEKEEVRRVILGTLICEVRGVHHVEHTDDQTRAVIKYQGFSGTFEFIDTDSERDSVSSGVLYMPGGINEILMSALINAQTDDPNATIREAFEVSVVRADNPAGYSWAYQPLVERAPEADPFSDLRKLAMARPAMAKALPAPTAQNKIEKK